MRSNPTLKTIHWTAAAVLIVSVAGCGDDDDDSSSASASESAYCVEAREWAIHEMKPVDDQDPAAFKSYWTEFQSFEQKAMSSAPDEVKADWKLKTDAENKLFTPVLEKYDYDINAIMESGTPEEQAGFDAPPDVQAAQDRILTYEGEVCGAQQPLAADVSFEGEVAGAYCDLVLADNERSAAVLADGADPAAVKVLFESFPQSEAELASAAPDIIKDDVVAVGKWINGRQKAAFERHDWDIKAVLRDGPAQDRADLNSNDPAIRDQFARLIAYEEQVCGA